MMKSKRCPFCKTDFPDTKLKDHINHDHANKLEASLRRTKIALMCVVVGFSVVIGMIYMGLLH